MHRRIATVAGAFAVLALVGGHVGFGLDGANAQPRSSVLAIKAKGLALESKIDAAPYQVSRPRSITRRTVESTRKNARYALLISLDGLSYPTLQRFLPRLPTLRKLAARGFSRPMNSVFPSMTWSAHVSAATGQYPRVHGILGNRWYESGKGVVKPYFGHTSDTIRSARTPSIYDLAAQRKWVTAAINWPATQHARSLTYNLPETMARRWLPARLLSPRLRKIVATLHQGRGKRAAQRRRQGWARRWQRLLGWIMVRENLGTDRLSTDLALKLLALPRKEIPRLMMLHLVAGDTVQHRRGLRSPAVFKTMRVLDRMVKEVLAAYRRAGVLTQTAIFVFSDHGFAEVHRTMDLRLLLKREGIARYRTYRRAGRVARERVLVVGNGHAAYVYVKNGDQKLIALIARLVKAKRYRRCVKAVYGPAQYAKLGLPQPLRLSGEDHTRYGIDRSGIYRHPGAPSLIVLNQPHCSFTNGHFRAIVRPIRRWDNRALHGYLPTHRSLQAFLIGAGAGIASKPTLRGIARIVDLSPTTARVLGLRWPRHLSNSGDFALDGRVLSDVLQ